MTNRLGNENSPYLLQHADNPVDWYPWGKEALDRAQTEDKPIFLSIGYAACHWCHVMAHESFENPKTAALMNQYFINIKVDREERPDIDNIYMNAIVAMTGQGGWPTSVFLTPDGRPFFGGTYYPPERRYNLPSFTQVLMSVAQIWAKDRQGILESSQQITQHLQQTSLLAGTSQIEFRPKILDQAASTLAQAYNWRYGGWGGAPMFPQAMVIEFLLGRATRGDQLSLSIANNALHAMARGGLYDVIGGGFARYSTDEQWLIPHFEKMLYDNALLARAYLHAYLITRDQKFFSVCTETLDFITREMTHPLGGFYSSLDADSEGVEGKYYLWSVDEIQALLGDEAEFFIGTYNVTKQGNFEGKTVLQRALDDNQLAIRFNIQIENVAEKLSTLHRILLTYRMARPHPATDDKVLLSWNALMLTTFAEAGRYLREPKYTNVAMRSAAFLLDHMFIDQRLYRSWRAGKALHPAFLEDYASLGLALLALYQSDPQLRWFISAKQLAHQILALFKDPHGGFFDTASDHENLILRPKNLQDNAIPSGGALTALLLLQLSTYTGNHNWRLIAESMLDTILNSALRYPTAFAQWLLAIDYASHPVQEIAILGEYQDPRTQALIDTVWSSYHPSRLTAIATYPPPEASPELLISRLLLNESPTAYVCQNFTCNHPVNLTTDLAAQLN